MTQSNSDLKFSDAEIAMLGSTADALSAYMGAAVLAEIDENDGAQCVIFARALDQGEPPPEDLVHVQMGGPNAQVLGQRGGLDTSKSSYDCEFLWAIEITDSPDERFVRLNPEGEVFDAANELGLLLPFSLEDPSQEQETDQESDEQSDAEGD